MAEIHDLLEELKESDDEYLQEQAANVEKYISEMEAGIIPEQLCRSYVQDVRDLIELNNLRDNIKNKAMAQKAVEILTKVLMKGIAAAIKGVL
jgi:hypothetical protein